MKLSTILLCNMANLGIGVLASVIGAIMVVFILFYVFRPRIKIDKEVAIDQEGKLMFCFRNKSIFPCINVHVYVKTVTEHDNADETEYKIRLDDDTSPYMSGCLSREKDTEVAVVTDEKISPVPPHLRMVVSAQHALSGVISVTTQDFVSHNAMKGSFEHGVFVPEGTDYARMYVRNKFKALRIMSWISLGLVILMTTLFGIFVSQAWLDIVLCFIILSAFFILILLLCLNFIQYRANAFSSKKISRGMRFLMVAFGKEFPKYKRDIVDIEADETQERPRRVRVRRN